MRQSGATPRGNDGILHKQADILLNNTAAECGTGFQPVKRRGSKAVAVAGCA